MDRWIFRLPTGNLQCGHGPKTVENMHLPVLHRLRPRPSMRPRSKDRGELPELECCQLYCEVLQCGHGPKKVENPESNRSNGGNSLSFNAATVQRPWRTPARAEMVIGHVAASMRRRSKDRGEGPRSRCPSMARKSFNAATVQRPWRTTVPPSVPSLERQLQCGHGPKTVENLRSSRLAR